MLKSGDTLKPTAAMAAGGEFNVLISDSVKRSNSRHTPAGAGAYPTGMVTGHRPITGSAIVSGNYILAGWNWYILPGRQSTANYGLDDGSVHSYRNVGIQNLGSDADFININPIGNNGNVLPSDTRIN